jgi:hypothetical protein
VSDRALTSGDRTHAISGNRHGASKSDGGQWTDTTIAPECGRVSSARIPRLMGVDVMRNDEIADAKDKVKKTLDDAASKAKRAANKVAADARAAARLAGQKLQDAGKQVKGTGG